MGFYHLQIYNKNNYCSQKYTKKFPNVPYILLLEYAQIKFKEFLKYKELYIRKLNTFCLFLSHEWHCMRLSLLYSICEIDLFFPPKQPNAETL